MTKCNAELGLGARSAALLTEHDHLSVFVNVLYMPIFDLSCYGNHKRCVSTAGQLIPGGRPAEPAKQDGRLIGPNEQAQRTMAPCEHMSAPSAALLRIGVSLDLDTVWPARGAPALPQVYRVPRPPLPAGSRHPGLRPGNARPGPRSGVSPNFPMQLEPTLFPAHGMTPFPRMRRSRRCSRWWAALPCLEPVRGASGAHRPPEPRTRGACAGWRPSSGPSTRPPVTHNWRKDSS